ncbi:hypothetical protein LY78DRAFT_655340 [Colletotrichum sublineola]|nr:hypothetical protein LY78DRAFT_655340 [Colletotrichum sublineola]
MSYPSPTIIIALLSTQVDETRDRHLGHGVVWLGLTPALILFCIGTQYTPTTR